jgi:hypothetical protein
VRDQLFEMALGISAPWHVVGTDLDVKARVRSIRVDLDVGRYLDVSAGPQSEQRGRSAVGSRNRTTVIKLTKATRMDSSNGRDEPVPYSLTSDTP